MVKQCEICGCFLFIEEDDPDIILEPYPHIECPVCHDWIAIF